MLRLNVYYLLVLLEFSFSESFSQSNFVMEVDGKKHFSNEKLIFSAGYHEVLFCFPEKSPQKKSYEYRLENIEKRWKSSNFSQIRYTNLRGGTYTFHGRTVENKKIIANYSFKFEIKENFWEKWWFWLFLVFFAALFIGFIIYFWFLYDFRQRMKTEQIRHRIAADLHDEVGANLSSITFLVESLKKHLNGNQANVSVLMERISANSMETATLINDTIWALNPSFDTFEKLLERIKSFASALLSSKDIAFTIENNLVEKNLDLSIEQRQNLYFIMKEAINNIAKHSSATKVFLKINEDEKRIKIDVEDNGVGFETAKIFDGNGLKNYQIRAQESGIDLKITSKIGFGTSVELLLHTKNH